MTADGLLQVMSAPVVALGWTLIDFCWQGALIAVLYAALRLIAGHGAMIWRSVLGRFTILAFLLTPLLTFLHHLGEVSRNSVSPTISSNGLPLPSVQAEMASASSAEWLLPYAVLIWAVGVGALALRGILHWRHLHKLSAEATPLPREWQERLERLHARLGVKARVALRESARVMEPILIGCLRPTIILPVGLYLRLPSQQVEMIIAHELAHVRRFDAWYNALLVVVQTLFFYHPGVHWVAKRIREDYELGCDAMVAASGLDRFAYARALLALAESRSPQTLALAATGGALLNRVELLLDSPRNKPSRLSTVLPIAVLVAGIGLLSISAERLADEDIDTGWMPMRIAPPMLERIRPALDLFVADLPTSQSLPPRLASVVIPVLDSVASPSLAIVPEAPRAMPIEIRPAALPLPIPDIQAEPPQVTLPALPARVLPIPQMESVTATAPDTLHREAPTYPYNARFHGIEGNVELSFTIDAQGRADDIRVESADQQAFATSARAALTRWRFPADASGERYLQRFEFSLADGASAPIDQRTGLPRTTAESTPCFRFTGSRLCRAIP